MTLPRPELLALVLANGWLLALPAAILYRFALRLAPSARPRLKLYAGVALMIVLPLLAAAAAAGGASDGASAIEIDLTAASQFADGVESSRTVSSVLLASLPSLWIAGAAILLAREAGGHFALAIRRRRWRAIEEPRFRHLGAARLMTGEGGSPMTIGLLRPVVYLPATLLDRLDRDSLEAIARHERSHARWRDPLTMALTRVVRILAWPIFPLIAIERLLLQEMEVAADAEALRDASGPSRVSYAGTLVEIARMTRGSRAAAHLTPGSLERRVGRLLSATAATPLRAAALTILLAGATWGATRLPAITLAPADLAVPREVARSGGGVEGVDSLRGDTARTEGPGPEMESPATLGVDSLRGQVQQTEGPGPEMESSATLLDLRGSLGDLIASATDPPREPPTLPLARASTSEREVRIVAPPPTRIVERVVIRRE